MPEGLLALLAAALSWFGFALTALAQERHWCAVAQVPIEARVNVAWLRAAALASHIAALLLFVRTQGPGFGSLLWVLALSAAAMTVAFTLAWRPGWLRLLVPVLSVSKQSTSAREQASASAESRDAEPRPRRGRRGVRRQRR